MENLTYEQIKNFIIVLLAIAGVVVLIGNVIKTLREWKKPGEDLDAWRQDVDRKLSMDDERLKAIEDGNKVVTRGVLALISHELNGNSTDKLQKSQAEITNYLIDR